MTSQEQCLQILKAWKNSELEIIVYWASGSGAVTFKLHGRIEDVPATELHVLGERETMAALSLEGGTFALVGPSRVRIGFRSTGAILELVL